METERLGQVSLTALLLTWLSSLCCCRVFLTHQSMEMAESGTRVDQRGQQEADSRNCSANVVSDFRFCERFARYVRPQSRSS